MSRINTNVSSLIAQRIVGQQNKGLNTSLERLSTGLRINRGGDDPAGLIASENLRSEKAAVASAIDNAERADQVVNIAEGGLQEISSLLLELQSLVGSTANAAGLSDEERQANQLQVDSIIQTIDRISSSTSFQGIKLLNGTFDFTIDNQDSAVADVKVYGAKLENNVDVDVQVVVTASAQHAGLYLSADGGLDLTDASSTFQFELGGAKGSRQFTFASGTSLTSVADSINTFKSVTGVSATVSGTGIVVKSTEYGSDQFVSFKLIEDGGQSGAIHALSSIDENTANTTGTSFSSVTGAVRDTGQDVGALVNGQVATGKGQVVNINNDQLNASIELTGTGASTLAAVDAFTITGGGARFHLGPQVNLTNQERIGLGNFAARNLGNLTNGYLDQLGSGQSADLIDGDLEKAQNIINKAITQVAETRGRLGAFQKNVLGATIRSLGVAYENTSAAESSIRDTDFASETAELTRSQILVQAATNTLSLANAQPQNVLALLR
jgi:flagellin